MKAFLLCALLSVSLCAAPLICPPSLSGSTPVDPTCPGMGTSIFADPGSHGSVWFEDLIRPTNQDYNDLVALFTVLGDGHQVQVTWFGADAAYNNQLWYGNVPLFTNQAHPGAAIINTTPFDEIVLRLVSPEGTFYTGGAARNADGFVHAWTEQYFAPASDAPEPGTWLSGGVGLALAACGIYRRKRSAARG